MDAILPSSKAPRFNAHLVVVLLPSRLAGRRGIVSLGSTQHSGVTSFKYTPLAFRSCVLPVVANERLFNFFDPSLLASRTGLDEDKGTRIGGATR